MVEALWAAFMPTMNVHQRVPVKSFHDFRPCNWLNAQQQTQKKERNGLKWASQRLITSKTCKKSS